MGGGGYYIGGGFRQFCPENVAYQDLAAMVLASKWVLEVTIETQKGLRIQEDYYAQ